VFQHHTGDEIFDLHRGLVGLDFAEHVAGADLVALLFQPFDQRTHGHGVAEFGHFDDFGHGGSGDWREKAWWARMVENHANTARRAGVAKQKSGQNWRGASEAGCLARNGRDWFCASGRWRTVFPFATGAGM
jgi:hypothetical protein